MKKFAWIAVLLVGMTFLGGCAKKCYDCCSSCGYCETCPSGCYDADGECND